MATIEKRGDSYRIIVSLGYDKETKKRIRRIRNVDKSEITETDKKKVKLQLDKIANDFETQCLEEESLKGRNCSFRNFIDIWESKYASKHLSVGVLEGYKRTLELKVYDVIGDIRMLDIKKAHIEKIYERMEESGISANSIRRTHAMLSGIFKFACKEEYIKENPCTYADVPKREVSKGVASFNVEQTYTFLKALELPYSYTYKAHKSHPSTGSEKSIKEYTGTHTISLQWKAFFNLAIFSGCRRGELIALTWNDIDFDNHIISITKSASRVNDGQIIKSPKTKSGYRSITVPVDCIALLRKWKNEQRELCLSLGTYWKGCLGSDFDNNFVFIQDNGAQMDLSSPSHKFKEIIEAYNKQYNGDLPLIRLHDLRHTNATLLIAQNTDMKTVSARLGHSSVATTMDIYTHALPENDQMASDTLENLLLKAK